MKHDVQTGSQSPTSYDGTLLFRQELGSFLIRRSQKNDANPGSQSKKQPTTKAKKRAKSFFLKILCIHFTFIISVCIILNKQRPYSCCCMMTTMVKICSVGGHWMWRCHRSESSPICFLSLYSELVVCMRRDADKA